MDQVPEKTVFVQRPTAKSDLFQTGDIVGQYSVDKVLGAGGMGVVYLVQHTALKKKFALKALPAALAKESSFVSRFKREAEMLARLKHNHIVNVTDFGESQGKLYLVLEYVDGGSVEEWFEKNRKPGTGMPPAEVCRLIGQVLQGLSHAHLAGIVHRDLKPANIMLEKTGEAKISDFGLARLAADEEYRRTGGTASPFQGDSVTTTGTIVGTIDFMSPEAKNMRPSDGRSDIYAVGVMTYYLLTGKKPSGMAQPASRLVPGLDPRWDKFIATCLAEDPADRYQTAAAALEGLNVLLQTGSGKRWVWPVALAAVLAVAAAGIGLWPRAAAPVATPPVAAPIAAPVKATPEAPPVTVAKSEPEPVKASPPAPVAPSSRRFLLKGMPVGAVVSFHGRNFPVGASGQLQLDFPPGPQSVRIKAPGYVDLEGDFGAGETETEATVVLEQVPPHPVRFTGLPAQAQLRIGDQTAVADGGGIARVELRPGRIALAVSAPKYATLEQEMNILQATESVALEMKRLPPPAEVIVMLADGSELMFKWVPAGEYLLGSPQEERGRQRNDLARTKTVVEKGFYIAATETTQRQHRALTGKNPSISRALGDETRPVEQVAWSDLTRTGGVLDKADDELRRLALPYKADLPSETEWEYACRAGAESAFNDGSQMTNERDDPALKTLAFYASGSAHTAPSPVAKFKPNAWGLYDMHGNVAEWTHGSRGPREPVLRGGNWKLGPAHCRSASRVELTPEARPNDTMGYRLVLRPTEE